MAPATDAAIAGSTYLNTVLNNRGGVYGYSSWKQVRQGDGPVARSLRETNKIGAVKTPPAIRTTSGFIQPTQPNTFVDYFEAPPAKNASPIYFYFEDNSDQPDPANFITLTVPSFRNQLDYFSNNGLNNRLGLTIDTDTRRAYNSALDFTLSSSLSVIVNYAERIYPSTINTYKPAVRGRQNYTINNIWNNDRTTRSTPLGGKENVFGMGAIASSSIWPMDGHLSFTATSSITASDGAGILQNAYSRFAEDGKTLEIQAAPTYVQRIPVGSIGGRSVFAGDAEWLAPLQSGKNPYENYTTYAERMRLVGKDYSILPEFRISELMETYVTANGGDFLANISNVFDLTGAATPNSSERSFYQTYTNGDFLRYFGVIDDDLNDQRPGDMKITRNKVTLRCNALVKFLPYKGFYPAERTQELSTLFSQSYGNAVYNRFSNNPRLFRTLLEPLYSPGIMFNTIKSGLAVSNFVVTRAGTGVPGLPPSCSISNDLFGPSGNPYYNLNIGPQLAISGTGPQFQVPINSAGWQITRVPFEALATPATFFNETNLSALGTSGSVSSYGYIYDTGIFSSSLGGTTSTSQVLPRLGQAAGEELYELAMDNFLCESNEIFMGSLTNFVSQREENFATVQSGTVYSMTLKLHRTQDLTPATPIPDIDKFDMYSNLTAFGTPLASQPTGSDASPTYDHLTPPYYDGDASVTFHYTASYTGKPTLDEIFSNINTLFNRTLRTTNQFDSSYNTPTPYPVSDRTMQIDQSYNLFQNIPTVPLNTNQQSNQWLIQSKFECPILNFATVSQSVPPATVPSVGSVDASELVTRGMWHQYGQIPTGSSRGVFAELVNEAGTALPSLASVVGFPTGVPQRVGSINQEYLLEEAIIAIPYKPGKNRRDFIKFTNETQQSDTYQKLTAAMQKYIFPPRFDFLQFNTVDPILMYVFEFSAKLSQQDLADIWQNLPPSIGEKFDDPVVEVEEKELLDLILDRDANTRWMVFKVKKRGIKDYEKYRRSLVSTADLSAFPDTITSPYSYNWPHDYFSLVELAQMDEQVQYTSQDLNPPAPTPPTDAQAPPQPAGPGPGQGPSRGAGQAGEDFSSTPQRSAVGQAAADLFAAGKPGLTPPRRRGGNN